MARAMRMSFGLLTAIALNTLPDVAGDLPVDGARLFIRMPFDGAALVVGQTDMGFE